MTFHTEIQVSTTDRVNVNQLGHYSPLYHQLMQQVITGPIQIVEVLDAPPIDMETFTIRLTVAIAPLYTLKQEMTYLYNYRYLYYCKLYCHDLLV